MRSPRGTIPITDFYKYIALGFGLQHLIFQHIWCLVQELLLRVRLHHFQKKKTAHEKLPWILTTLYFKFKNPESARHEVSISDF